MKWLYRICLWLACIAIPAVIAACYGAPYRTTRPDRVMDGGSHLTRGKKAARADRGLDMRDVHAPGKVSCSSGSDVPCSDVEAYR